MKVVIDYKALKGRHTETVINEIALVAEGVIRTLHLQAPYNMRPQSSSENGFNLVDGHIPIINYKRLLLKLWQDTHICNHTAMGNEESFPT